VKLRAGAAACPLNALYWNFLAIHEQQLRGNPRLMPMYRLYDKFDASEKARIADSAQDFLAKL
jgi:deoxyribodipyrimidine photolyase-related protein